MTAKSTSEADEEWLYIKTERLGIMCGSAEPTPEQIAIAEAEATERVANLKLQ